MGWNCVFAIVWTYLFFPVGTSETPFKNSQGSSKGTTCFRTVTLSMRWRSADRDGHEKEFGSFRRSLDRCTPHFLMQAPERTGPRLPPTPVSRATPWTLFYRSSSCASLASGGKDWFGTIWSRVRASLQPLKKTIRTKEYLSRSLSKFLPYKTFLGISHLRNFLTKKFLC
jgi:hypothetical protein